MKFDFSTILLVIVAVIPGLFAQRFRDQIFPRSFASQGAITELAELVALGVATHGIVLSILAAVLFMWGRFFWHDPFLLFSILDSFDVDTWCSRHVVEASVYAILYIFASFIVSHWLGFIYGIWRTSSPIINFIFAKATWLTSTDC